jgi:hypothetical protein
MVETLQSAAYAVHLESICEDNMSVIQTSLKFTGNRPAVDDAHLFLLETKH